MEHEPPAIFVVLEQSAFAAAIRQSPLLYPLANVGHIVALMIFAGALAVMDLRLIGAFSATEPALVLSRARRVAIAAFAALGVSGMVLFVADASHLAVNPVFICKQTLVAAGLRAGIRTRRAAPARLLIQFPTAVSSGYGRRTG
jgi:hypothetical protein